MKFQTLPAIEEARRKFLVPAGRIFNTGLDTMFYDVNSLTPQEQKQLRTRIHPEGSVLVVHPAAEAREIENYTFMDFINSRKKLENDAVDTIVAAGVGSSDLGTAALARNAADKLKRPVAGIVAGYGLADMVSEAMGGWFVFGLKNAVRDGLARIFDMFQMKDHVWDDDSYRSLVGDERIRDFEINRFMYGSPDSTALLLILYHLSDRIRVLVGHSKGNYVIENALEGLVELCKLKHRKIPRDIQIITMGAVLRFPEQFSKVVQFIGSIDWFGMFNSRPGLNPHRIPGAWHSLNTDLFGHMSVGAVLESAQVQ